MRGIVVSPFPYAADGLTTEMLQAGDVRDFGDLARGLAEGGLIELESTPPRQGAATEEKGVTSSPENKAIGTAPENKSGRGRRG